MADYNINAVARRVVFTGSAGLGPYAFTFEILDDDDLAVYFNSTKLTKTTDYTVTINANGTGSVNVIVNAGGNIPQTPTASDSIIIVGARDIERVTDFVTAGDLLASSLNEQLDALTIFDQQVAEEQKRSLQAPVYDPAHVDDGGTLDMTLPAKADRLNKTLAFNATTGNPEAGPTVDEVSNAQTYANNASTSATAAASSASSAASSASSASTAQTAAETAQTAAETAETNAETAQTAAETAQTAAEAAQTAAETAETNAATSATTATTKASEAATSATNAATSASNAATSASNASTSETNAATSASAAAASQTAAATSAAAAASAFDNFDDTYLGSFSSDPTVDNDGDPLTTGDLYFNSTANEMRVYDGANWIAASSAGGASLILYEYTATSGQTTFSGSDDNAATLSYTADNIQVVMNGIVLDPSDYTASNGTSVVLATGAAAGSLINIYAFKSFTVADTVSASAGGTFSGNVTVNALLNVDNLRLDGNTISSTDTNGDITLDPDGTGDTIVASGNVGIGTSTVDSALHIEQDASGVTETSGSTLKIHNTNASGRSKISLHNSAETASGSIYYDTDSGMLALQGDTGAGVVIQTSGNNERLRVDTSGNVGIGTASPSYPMELSSSSGAGTQFGITYAPNSVTLLARAGGADANIGTVGAHPLLFKTNNTENMRILSNGALCVGKTSTSTAVNGAVFQPGQLSSVTRDGAVFRIRRLTSDGTLIEFYQDTGLEGSIGVSGTTVSYNGGHLSRWSQLTDGTEDLTIVKGTVMTNLDQMAVWHHEAQPATYYEEGDELPEGVSVGDEKTPAVAAYDEDNEQLNCMAVSSVEGDANVAGVFVNWDDDDDFNDMNVAMTGDMVIRIAQGTTVARGDLLMSAGDGTAKPQGDDIVRSKTIAKVTSTTVSHTYDDGSYLVPCVLMAC